MTRAAEAVGSAETLRTEFPFLLPQGYIDEHGARHREGVMRFATARDEIMPLRDARVRENEAYLSILLLSRVIVRLGELPAVTPGVLEGLFAGDLAFLQGLYRRINLEGTTEVAVCCPHCRKEYSVDVGGGAPGESS